MPSSVSVKPGSLKDPSVASLFSTKDPEQRFVDLREIGHGSSGAVFFAQDNETNTTVAIKKMAFSGKQAVEKWGDIIKEVSFLKNIKHQNIVEYRACYLKDHTCWLVMEYCIGSAADIVEVHRNPLREREIAAIIQQTLCGLAYLHNAGRIHRDVKAGNILLTDLGTVKLADFGSASIACPAQSFVGTPYWMAPEVILAMDEGHYHQSADIWSLGITCIELAERRPPLFNMNAMSALYHIAQNDPPSLSPVPSGESLWSADFRSFVDSCLCKEPHERMKTDQCQKHSFLCNKQLDGVILQLISRTKALVSDLDNFQYRKMRKLVYLDEQQSANAEDTAQERHEGDEELSVVGGSASSRSNSVSSFQSYHSHNINASDNNGIDENNGIARPRVPNHMFSAPSDHTGIATDDLNLTDKNRTIILVGDGTNTVDSNRDSSLDENASSTLTSTGISAIQEMTRPINDEMATLRRSKFSTLRTTKLISKEMEEYNRENNIYEQMSGYKRLRQNHQKELKQHEERCALEMDTLKQKADKEYEQLLSAFSKELQRSRTAQSNEKDKKLREYDDMERKLRRKLNSKYESELKAFSNVQKNEYKHDKEKAKIELKEICTSRSAFENALKDRKAMLTARRTGAEMAFSREQKLAMDSEIKRLKRARIIALQSLEEKLIAEELKLRSNQLETSHALLRKHHDRTRELELTHLAEGQRMKRRHLVVQHEAESTNQLQYNQRATNDLSKRHALQSKQQPKELKAKELRIRKQYRQAVKTQLRQSKLLQTQVLSTTPKEEHREMIAKLKEEQKRKLATLSTQYDTTIERVVQDLIVKLESWQEDEAKVLKEKLEKELEMLKVFQSRQKACLEENCKREEHKLADRIAIRKAVLEKKMEEERNSLDSEREKILKSMIEKHSKELSTFDGEQRDQMHSVPSASQFSSLNAFRTISASIHSLTTS